MALMTNPCPALPDGLGGSLGRFVEGLNSKQSLLTVNTCGVGAGGSALPGASLCLGLPASHELLSEPCPSHHVQVRGHLWWEKWSGLPFLTAPTPALSTSSEADGFPAAASQASMPPSPSFCCSLPSDFVHLWGAACGCHSFNKS